MGNRCSALGPCRIGPRVRKCDLAFDRMELQHRATAMLRDSAVAYGGLLSFPSRFAPTATPRCRSLQATKVGMAKSLPARPFLDYATTLIPAVREFLGHPRIRSTKHPAMALGTGGLLAVISLLTGVGGVAASAVDGGLLLVLWCRERLCQEFLPHDSACVSPRGPVRLSISRSQCGPIIHS